MPLILFDWRCATYWTRNFNTTYVLVKDSQAIVDDGYRGGWVALYSSFMSGSVSLDFTEDGWCIMQSSMMIQGHEVEFRADGRLADISQWTPELAQAIAEQDGMSLTPEHWNVINTMREYYQEYNTSPILKLLRRELSRKYGAEHASDQTLSRLFPMGVQYQGTRIAGVPLAYLDAELEQTTHMRAVKPGTDAKKAHPVFEFDGRQIKMHPSGNLVDLADWNEEMAVALARKEGIELTDKHWEVLNFLRSFYFKYGVTPMVKILLKHMREELGQQAVNRDDMYRLFPQGPARQGSRIAGLPSPQGCIDP